MKTATIFGKVEKLEYRANTSMYTRHLNPITEKWGQYSGNVYNVIGRDEKVLVATATNGSEIKNTTTVLSAEEYESISDLYDPYKDFIYHNEIMSRMGFENGFK